MASRHFLILRRLQSSRLEGWRAARPPARVIGILMLALVMVLVSLPALAEDLAGVVPGLAGDSFAAKAEAITALGKLGDPGAVPILQALGEDRLRRAPDGRVVLMPKSSSAAKPLDAVSGQELDLAPDSLDRIIVNNRLRNLIEATLGSLTLFSPDRGVRLGAAQDAMRHPSPDNVG